MPLYVVEAGGNLRYLRSAPPASVPATPTTRLARMTGLRLPVGTAPTTPGGGGGTPPGTGSTAAVTHAEQLTELMVGPWALQGTAIGSETLSVLAAPSRGYWRADAPTELVPSQPYVYNNSPTNFGGVVPAGGLTIDGYSVPAGTNVVQFRDMSATDMLCQDQTSGTWLFRGCRFRNNATGDTAQFNDARSTSGFSIKVHYCDFGGADAEKPNGPFLKFIGGANHRVLRTRFTNIATAIQPNAPGTEVTENLITRVRYYYGEKGTSGNGPDSTTFHINGISIEGGINGLKILRNNITVPSPDACTGGGTSAAGQPGYGTQPGQLGYGAGSNPGRLVTQTDCIALFTLLGANTNVVVDSNYLGGSGWVAYAVPGSTWTNNKITTKWWTNGGNFGAINGSGYTASNNVWADDYGTGGDGSTLTTQRQYPTGNGPRAGTPI